MTRAPTPNSSDQRAPVPSPRSYSTTRDQQTAAQDVRHARTTPATAPSARRVVRGRPNEDRRPSNAARKRDDRERQRSRAPPSRRARVPPWSLNDRRAGPEKGEGTASDEQRRGHRAGGGGRGTTRRSPWSHRRPARRPGRVHDPPNPLSRALTIAAERSATAALRRSTRCGWRPSSARGRAARPIT